MEPLPCIWRAKRWKSVTFCHYVKHIRHSSNTNKQTIRQYAPGGGRDGSAGWAVLPRRNWPGDKYLPRTGLLLRWLSWDHVVLRILSRILWCVQATLVWLLWWWKLCWRAPVWRLLGINYYLAVALRICDFVGCHPRILMKDAPFRWRTLWMLDLRFHFEAAREWVHDCMFLSKEGGPSWHNELP